MKKKNAAKNTKASFEKFAGKLEMNKELLSNVGGKLPGDGYFYTISGECWGRGSSCWPF
jgi:hypothetical protein